MTTWTLWLVLVLTDGSLSVMEGRTFTTEASCRQVANYARTQEITGVTKVLPVCKKATNV
jgi:hypothetical protein